MKKESYITVYESVGGWKALLVWWNPEMGGFWEPYQTGIGFYETREGATEEAKMWSLAEGLEFKVGKS